MDRTGTEPDAFRLDGRCAIVTGASSGLGAAVARSLSAAGASVVLAARRADKLEALSRELPGSHAVGCDVTAEDDRARLVQTARQLGGPIDILVNAAGAFTDATPAEEEPLDRIMGMLELNLVAPFRLSQLVFADMSAAGRGSIVHISSISGIVGVKGIPQASYAAAKRGLSGLAAELAVQWGPRGIRVNTLATGFFKSELTEGLYEDERSIRWLDRGTPLPHHADASDMASAVLFLTSDAGRMVTGQTVVIDGGWTIQ